VVTAIVIALAGIAASVYVRATERGRVDVEINQMHQIGLAANLYHEQYDSWPVSTMQLVDAHLIPKEICLSPRDRYENGFSNAWLKDEGSSYSSSQIARRVSPFPNTYICLGDMVDGHQEDYAKEMTDEPNFGLFVANLDAKMVSGNTVSGVYEGLYRRVLLDTSVVVRHHQIFKGLDHTGKPIKFGGIISWFVDPSEQWIKEHALTF